MLTNNIFMLVFNNLSYKYIKKRMLNFCGTYLTCLVLESCIIFLYFLITYILKKCRITPLFKMLTIKIKIL